MISAHFCRNKKTYLEIALKKMLFLKVHIGSSKHHIINSSWRSRIPETICAWIGRIRINIFDKGNKIGNDLHHHILIKYEWRKTRKSINYINNKQIRNLQNKLNALVSKRQWSRQKRHNYKCIQFQTIECTTGMF